MTVFCSSNVLWFVNGRVGLDGLAHVTSKDVAVEFGVAEECAQEQLSLLCDAGFVRRVSSEVYEVLQKGKDECAFLSQFVSLGVIRKINPRTAIRISAMLREWFRGKSANGISRERAEITATLHGRKFKCTDEEFELAKRLMS